MSTIKGELQHGITNAMQRLVELIDEGWIVETRRGYDAWGRYDETYILNCKTNTNLGKLRSKQ